MRIDISQLEFIDIKLRHILTDLEQATGYEFTITSLYRIGDSGVHGTLPLRGTDLRMRNKTIGQTIEEFINRKWAYNPQDPDRKVGFLHGSGSNLHLHVQVHPQTTLK